MHLRTRVIFVCILCMLLCACICSTSPNLIPFCPHKSNTDLAPLCPYMGKIKHKIAQPGWKKYADSNSNKFRNMDAVTRGVMPPLFIAQHLKQQSWSNSILNALDIFLQPKMFRYYHCSICTVPCQNVSDTWWFGSVRELCYVS